MPQLYRIASDRGSDVAMGSKGAEPLPITGLFSYGLN